MAVMTLHYDIDGENFVTAGEASGNVKRTLKKLGVPAHIIRKVAIAMYEGEINMVIHAGGGIADVIVETDKITIVLKDNGPGIENVELAMKAGYSTAPDSIRALGFGAGMGLPNMKSNTDEMYIDTVVGEGTKIKMIFNVD